MEDGNGHSVQMPDEQITSRILNRKVEGKEA